MSTGELRLHRVVPLHLSEELQSQILDHCRSASPNEGCGLFAVDGTTVARIYPTANADESPHGYTVPPAEHFAALQDAEANGWALGGVFHSHPNGEARPSMVDVMSALDPEWTYLVVGLRGSPQIRAWEIKDGAITEVELR